MSEVGSELHNDSGSWMRAQLEMLGETQAGLARFLKRNGDDREITNIERSIRRMTAGDARVSGEMRAILGILRKRHQRAIDAATTLEWGERPDGAVTATTHDGFEMTLVPMDKGRWKAIVVYKATGYSVSYRPWEHSLEKSKAVALSMVDEARRDPHWER